MLMDGIAHVAEAAAPAAAAEAPAAEVKTEETPAVGMSQTQAVTVPLTRCLHADRCTYQLLLA